MVHHQNWLQTGLLALEQAPFSYIATPFICTTHKKKVVQVNSTCLKSSEINQIAVQVPHIRIKRYVASTK